ncbi:TPA: Dam family site-specific DNA-(adenine-N6)-methyltransferase [Streptococcus agalactiae]|uniref:Dam family site-specific DNA-(adenine-N6)-methyltransferase n=1 Tax=Peptoniphilus sp. SGI.035 TaxID=3420564 RepID=UPI002B3EAAAF|nr:Dam family site-specific DNA-(adenine-N6)-methyltransferase [Streptococcus pyogenes]
MRYLGNKEKLTWFIEEVIEKHNIEGEVFADLFSGTCSVGDYFKDKYKIIANDYMYFSKIIAEAKLLNATAPKFSSFINKYDEDPFIYLNNRSYRPGKNFYIYNNYTPVGNRMYLTESNAIKIDGMRLDIEEFYKDGDIDYSEYCFLLASLFESVMKVSNTTGTYQAFLKFWESRSLKEFELTSLELNSVEEIKDNTIFCENTNKLVREIEGDIAYLDPPYTINQYTNSYHLIETIAKYDYPEIFGKTGRRKKRELSDYSNKTNAIYAFEDLFRQIKFKHILVSYSNQSILSIDEMVNLASKFAKNNKVYVEKVHYREYATNNLSMKGNGKSLKECIIYFEKDFTINKSPLNYSGSKDKVADKIFKYLPNHVSVFVDAMGGAFNIGANIQAMDKVIYNEYNPFIYSIIKMLLESEPEALISDIEQTVKKFNLKKKHKDEYIKFRDHYNKQDKSPLNLFVLQIYAFQNMIRFNNSYEMNTPVGNNEYCESIKERILGFIPKTKDIELLNKSYEDIDIEDYPLDTVFYFDPPYFITKAEYNDGKRGFKGWDSDEESKLLDFLNHIDQSGRKFMLSNVVEHNGKVHNILIEWIKSHGYSVHSIGQTGIKYPRKEVLVTNY